MTIFIKIRHLLHLFNEILHHVCRTFDRDQLKIRKKISEEIELFKLNIKSLIEKARDSDEPVINSDESGFQILPKLIKTWLFKKTKKVSINVADSDKERVSIMASITSDYKKLPLFIIGKGECLEEAQEKLGETIDDNYLTFSSK